MEQTPYSKGHVTYWDNETRRMYVKDREASVILETQTNVLINSGKLNHTQR